MNCILNNFKTGFGFGFAHHFMGGLLAPFMPNFSFFNQYSNPYSSYMGSCFNFVPQRKNYFPTEFLKFDNLSYQQSIWDTSFNQQAIFNAGLSTSFDSMPLSYNNGISNSLLDFYNDLGFDSISSSKGNLKTKKSKDKVKVTANAEELAKKWQKLKPKAKDITKEFCQKVIDISKEIECTPDDLMTVINLETAGTFSPSVQNKNTKATGLIQFMPNTAASLFTSAEKAQKMTKEEQMVYIEKLKSMSAIEQLDYVKKFLINGKNTRKITGSIDATTLYCLIFWPEAATKEDSFVIAKNDHDKTEDTYDLNKGLDANKDNVITRGDLRARVAEFMA